MKWINVHWRSANSRASFLTTAMNYNSSGPNKCHQFISWWFHFTHSIELLAYEVKCKHIYRFDAHTLFSTWKCLWGTLHENINNLYAFISRALASKYFNPKTSSHKRQFVITLICVIFSNNNKNSVWNVGVFIRLYLLPETFARLRKNESFGYS